MSKGLKVVWLKQIKTWSQYVVTNKKSEIQSHKPNSPIDDKINSKISLWQGDITHLHVDSIVNAAKESMLGGGGVDGDIHRAAGPKLLEECKKVGPCQVGSAKLTTGCNLPARFIIHTVGPQKQNDRDLINCYDSSLNVALENKFASIAFPCIGTGVYSFPLVPAAHIASATVREFMNNYEKECKYQRTKLYSRIERIIFCTFNKQQTEIYEAVLPVYFPKSTST